MSKSLSVILIVFGILLLQIASLTFWARFGLLEQSRFTTLCQKTFEEEKIRQVLAHAIVERVFPQPLQERERPQELMEAAIGGILGSPLLNETLQLTSQVIFRVLTSDHTQGVYFEITPIKESIPPILQALARQPIPQEKLAQIPDRIELISAETIPPVHKIRPTLFLIFILSGLLSLSFIALAIFKASNKNFSLKWLGVLLILSSVLVFISLYPSKNLMLSFIQAPIGKVFAEVFFRQATFSLKIQLSLLTLFGIFSLAMGRHRRDLTSKTL